MKASTRRIGLVVAVLSSVAGAAGPDEAGPVLSFTGSTGNSTAADCTRGFFFDVTAPAGVLVTGLSVFDHGGNGLMEPHEVGIWDKDGTLLVSATVPRGTSAPLDINGLFRVVAVPPTLLAAGTDYAVGARFPERSADLQAIPRAGVSVDPRVVITGGANIFSQGPPTRPTRTTAHVLVGGSFEIGPAAAAPEPDTPAGALVGVGLLGGAWLRRWRKAA